MSFTSKCVIWLRNAILASVVGMIVSGEAMATDPWWNTSLRYRLPIAISANGIARTDRPAEVTVNFTSVLTALGKSGALDVNSLRVVEVDNAGTVTDASVVFQFDPDADFNASTKASGVLTLLMSGSTGAAQTRSYYVYFDLAGGGFTPPSFASQVTITDNVMDAGQSSFRVNLQGSTLYYHKQGAGFSSWLDSDGNDWLSFDPTPGSGSAGEYRGIPNAVFPEGHFHPGKTSSTSSIVSQGPIKIRIQSTTTDGKWSCTWDFYPKYATMTMTKADHNYWLLYEGTPGGTIDVGTDFMYTSNGTKSFLSSSWTGDISGDEWAYFSDPNVGTSGRSLYLAHHESDGETDSYYPMNDEMTVFGFGRDGINTYLSSVPQHLTIGLVDGTAFGATSAVVQASYKSVVVTPGTPDKLDLVAPTLLAPADNALNLPSSVTVSWHAVATATSYRLQVATDGGFSSVVVDDSTLTDTTRQLTGLQTGTAYFWRVRAKSVSGTGSYSTPWHFSTSLAVPVLSSPANGTGGSATSVSLGWHSVPNATSYHCEVATDPGFGAGIVLRDTSVTDTTKMVTGLSTNTTYYWRVSAAGPGGLASAFSAPWSFSTAIPVPTLLSPANGATGQPLEVRVQWARIASASFYHLQASTDSSFATALVVNDSLLSDTSRVLSGLAGSSRYYWRVRAGNGILYGAFSAAHSFATVLAGPLLESPADEATGLPTTVTFLWHPLPGVTGYKFELATDSSFTTGLVKNDTSVVDTSRFVAGLLKYVRYFWRVAGRTAGGYGAFSPVWAFRTAAQLPDTVQLVSPAPNAIIASSNVRFTWHASQPGVLRYWFELSVDSNFVFHQVDSTLTDTTKVEATLQLGKAYWWRVRAANVGGWGPFSVVRKATVPSDGVPSADAVPTDFALAQNYPNPFNPTTIIAFSLPRESRVRLEVFSLTGERIALLLDERRSAGVHQVAFDPAALGLHLSSGMYLYRLTSGEKVFAKKMLLLK